jgi:uncharacterized protein involved in response to NO
MFPLGVLFGLLGVSVWVVLSQLPDYAFAARLHSELMIGTFLFAFAAGFLMTAIPKMTASFPACTFELGSAFLLVLANFFFALGGHGGPFFISAAISILLLIGFFIRRFVRRTKVPPSFFPFIAAGLGCGLSGALLLALSTYVDIPGFWSTLGKRLYFDAMILFLVLGIGSRLIPVISGREVSGGEGRTHVVRNIFFAMILLSGFAVQAAGSPVAGGLLKFTAAALVAWFNWRLFARSNTKSRLALGMRMSGLLVLPGLFFSAIHQAFAVHWMHLTYIGGFGLMTLTVASRVTLAHGSYDLSFEHRSKALWATGSLILLAAFARVAAPFTGAGYFNHLLYAAVAWILALVIWASVFVARMVKKGRMNEPACR